MKFNIVLYIPELKYQKNREEIFLSFNKYDKINKYLYFSLKTLEYQLYVGRYRDLIELLMSIDSKITKSNINHIIFYPRQLKNIDPNLILYKLIINCKIKKSIFIDDVHNIEVNLDILNKFDNKIMTYEYLKDTFLIGLNKNIISCPHYLNDCYIYNNETKDIKISILGHTPNETYLTRKYIMENFENINKELKNCSIECYPKLESNMYFEILKRSYASIATTGDNPLYYYPYIVSKYFEIPGCNSLLIAHILPEMEDEFKKYGFIENENYIRFKDIPDLIQKCNYIFDPKNKDHIEKIRHNGYNLVLNNHLISHRLRTLVKMLNNN